MVSKCPKRVGESLNWSFHAQGRKGSTKPRKTNTNGGYTAGRTSGRPSSRHTTTTVQGWAPRHGSNKSGAIESQKLKFLGPVRGQTG